MTIARTILFALVCLLLFAPIWVSQQRIVDDNLYYQIEDGILAPEDFELRPFRLQSIRRAALQMLYAEPYLPEKIESYLSYILKYLPLYGPNWLDLAELHQRQGDLDDSRQDLHRAAMLMPTQGEMQWRVAMLRATLGDSDEALKALGRFTQNQPENTLVAYNIARRLIDDKSYVVETLLPGQQSTRELRKSMALRLLRSGLEADNLELVRLVWDLSPAIRSDRDWSRGLAARLFGEGDKRFLDTVWESVFNVPRAFDELINGDFEADLLGHVYGWTSSAVEGARVDIDSGESFNGRRSLRIRFDGKTNLNFNHLYQVAPVTGAGTYTLQGYWRGAEVSTRSGVYVELTAHGDDGRVSSTSSKKFGDWDWESFSIELEVPETAKFLQIKIRRRETTMLDKLQSGVVWLDEFSLVRTKEKTDNVGRIFSESQ